MAFDIRKAGRGGFEGSESVDAGNLASVLPAHHSGHSRLTFPRCRHVVRHAAETFPFDLGAAFGGFAGNHRQCGKGERGEKKESEKVHELVE
jgi:hypothetical protein